MMTLLLGQLVYTSFAGSGLKVLASAGISRQSRMFLPTDLIQLMLGMAIATTTFALLGLTYSLLTTTSIFAPKQSESSLLGRSLIVKA